MPSITLNALDLKKLLKPVVANVNASTVLPILENIFVQVSKTDIKFSSSDLETSTILTIKQNSDEPFKFLINARSLYHFVANAVSDDITITASNNGVLMQSDTVKVKMPYINTDDYVKFPVFEEDNKTTFDCSNLMFAIKTSMPFVSRDYLRPAMTGVYLHDDNGELTVASTDAHRLYFKPIMKPPTRLQNLSLIIPIKACRQLTNVFTKGDITIQNEESYTRVFNDEYEIIFRPIDARYPDYKVVMVRHDFKFALKRKQFASFLKISNRFVNKSTYQMNVHVFNDRIEFDGSDVDFEEEISYTLPIYNLTKETEPFEFALNLNFLMQALAIDKKDEYVTIEHSKMPTKAMVIDNCLMLMPLMMH